MTWKGRGQGKGKGKERERDEKEMKRKGKGNAGCLEFGSDNRDLIMFRSKKQILVKFTGFRV